MNKYNWSLKCFTCNTREGKGYVSEKFCGTTIYNCLSCNSVTDSIIDDITSGTKLYDSFIADVLDKSA
jgi:hypothetical protein